MSVESRTPDFKTADFNAVYEGGDFLPGAEIKVVPWDIRAAQPAVIEMEGAGRFHGEVLDLGCGLGDNAVFLAGRGHAVTAVDGASLAIEQARLRAEQAGVGGITFEVADATRLDGYEGHFDSVLDSALFHTMDPDARHALAAAEYRVTKPGAYLNMLAFADVPGGMPAPLSVSEYSIRNTLELAGWEITGLSRETFLGVSQGMETFLERNGVNPELDGLGRTQLPVWQVQASRV